MGLKNRNEDYCYCYGMWLCIKLSFRIVRFKDVLQRAIEITYRGVRQKVLSKKKTLVKLAVSYNIRCYRGYRIDKLRLKDRCT